MGLEEKPVGKPDAVAPHVRFDERGWETGLDATAPILDSTSQTKIEVGGDYTPDKDGTLLLEYLLDLIKIPVGHKVFFTSLQCVIILMIIQFDLTTPIFLKLNKKLLDSIKF